MGRCRTGARTGVCSSACCSEASTRADCRGDSGSGMTGVGQVGDRASRADRGQWSSDLHGSSADPRLPPRLLVAEEGRGIMLLKLFWLNSSVGLARGSNNM